MPDGTPVYKVTLQNGELSVSFITYGGTVTEILFGGRDLALGYNSLSEYLADTSSIGVTVGRYANRIAGGLFTLGGKTFDVGCNEAGRGHLHGGEFGFQKRVWDITELNNSSATIHYLSPDGEMGYPGTLDVYVTFTVTEDDEFKITYSATSDKDTVLNLTNHTYFNLGGGEVLDTELLINADAILPVDEVLIPTGEYMSVENTPFDFRTAKPIGRDINGDHPQLKICGGYDHNFCLGDKCEYRHAATAKSPKTNIKMECYTDQPGIQLYTGNFLETDCGKDGAMERFGGFCLETQHYPDSPNNPHFPTTVLKAGATFESVTCYKFSK